MGFNSLASLRVAATGPGMIAVRRYDRGILLRFIILNPIALSGEDLSGFFTLTPPGRIPPARRR
ncbi:MAG: hypothetical protein NZ935_10250, partial [Planctomycetes bacterium]|nr:hypothetical protein [Planctomycetota bacterium]